MLLQIFQLIIAPFNQSEFILYLVGILMVTFAFRFIWHFVKFRL